ncbi:MULTISPECIES: hypothetical protein [Spirulina sp. CCY15215]|uniref:hypothetical protein n=1 Tax=Spirulina sp. CCY15215 TaxID=2767591 RepID=UPI001951F871|nr:hypothetical protein [Spirulina major]
MLTYCEGKAIALHLFILQQERDRFGSPEKFVPATDLVRVKVMAIALKSQAEK